MNGGWRYRVVSTVGVICLSALVVATMNSHPVQTFVSGLPVLGRLPTDPPSPTERLLEITTTAVAVTASLVPLYKPRPRRILDIILLSQKRILVALFALAAVGYFDYTYRLPRVTLLMIAPVLLTGLPLWLIWIRDRPNDDPANVLIVGDNADEIRLIATDSSLNFVGYLCPPGTLDREVKQRQVVADGGVRQLNHLGGLSRLKNTLVEYNIDAVVLAFKHSDRGEFFGALDTCHEHGLTVKTHRAHADAVLTSDESVGPLVDVEIEPWDPQDYLLKRLFDFGFALTGLLATAPLIGLIAAVIRLDDGGPVLYQQERTAVLGKTFELYKFRTMVTEGESAEPVDDEQNNRITGVGRVLRRTHLDEIPQLWSILIGDMSVVGPRAVWTEEETILESEVDSWRQRWFVKPGLTGLAQINDVESTEPREKIRYDLQYVRRQSFWLDMKIIIRQFWKVLRELASTWD